jgi:hypothetical protein
VRTAIFTPALVVAAVLAGAAPAATALPRPGTAGCTAQGPRLWIRELHGWACTGPQPPLSLSCAPPWTFPWFEDGTWDCATLTISMSAPPNPARW